MRCRRAGAALAALALAACAGEPEAARPAGDAPPPAAGAPTIEASNGAPAPAADPPSLDPAEVEAAIAADDSLEAYNRRTFEQRRRSMATYEQCIAQARDLPPPSRARIQQACAARRDGS